MQPAKMNIVQGTNQNYKRRHEQNDKFPVVDDMTVAMQAATAHLVSLVAYESSSASEDDTDDDDGVGSKGAVSSTEEYVHENDESTKDVQVTHRNDVESDDESDVDLSEALAKMEKDYGSDVEQSAGARNHSRNRKKDNAPAASGPRTTNEIDAYGSKLPDQLISAFVATKIESELVKSSQMGNNLCIAGHVKYHLSAERTLVVESEICAAHHGPLDEGSLLMFRDFCGQDIVLIGKIFEVFGPVTRPLYTIRLLNSSESSLEATIEKNSDGDEAKIVVKNENSDGIVKKKENGDKKEEDRDKSTDVPLVTDKITTDPWSEDGSFTMFLKSATALPVYYIKGSAQSIDTGMVLRQSGKGCDASNIHDEEVPLNQVEFSDDEEERRVKNAAKQKKKGKSNNRVVSDGGLSAAAAAAGYPNASSTNRPTYHPPQSYSKSKQQQYPSYPQQMHQQQAQYSSQPQQYHFGYAGAHQQNHNFPPPPYYAAHGYPPPLPPPPPQHYAYNNLSTMYSNNAPAPPPYNYTGAVVSQSTQHSNQQDSSNSHQRMTNNPYQN